MSHKKKGEKVNRTIKVEVPATSYRRWRVDPRNPRVVFLDFRCIRSTNFKSVDYGCRRNMKWNSPEHLQHLVDMYFASCFGPIFDRRTGTPFVNPDGTIHTGQIKPFTLSGLACYIHISSKQLKRYSRAQLDSLGFPTDEDYVGLQYSEIIAEAKKRIEAYAEERLYDRDGFGGGKFVLNSAFGWQERMEVATIKNMKAQYKLKKKEQKLKRELMVGDDSEEPITINIVRAKKENENE